LNKWLLLIYKIPREPSAGRVYVWRKLKLLGALALQDAAWILPATPRTQENFQWLAAEITELKGEATLFVTEFVFGNDSQDLIDQFEQPVKDAYQEILSALKRKAADLAALSNQFQQIQARDYFQCKLGPQVRAKLLAAQRGK
jgi:hypothetical protein